MNFWFSENHTPNVKLSIRVDRQLYSGKSEFQRIDVFDSPEFGRFLTLDGYMMLTEKDEFIYHEMITHVPMAVHPLVKKVLVIGAGDGGVIRELTRYPEIEHIDMVEIDPLVLEVCRKYLPKTACRLDDPRLSIHYEDGLKYVRFKENEYDLIIVDSTDPFGPGEGLFTREFYGNCYKALKEDGIMVNQHHEAGEFIRRNLRDFPSPLPAELFNTLARPKEIHYIAAPTENAQARYLPAWIRENLTKQEKETAIVLCNEALLQPVLHSLPDEVKHVNITMGFPLSQTPVYSFLTSLLELHTHGYNQHSGRYTYLSVVTLLKHPYTRQLSSNSESLEKELTKHNRFYPLPGELQRDEFLTLLFTPPSGSNLSLCLRISEILQQIAGIYRNETEEDLYRESLFKAYTTVSRFRTLIEEGELTVRPETLRRLLVKVLSATNIPFHGEPAIGMQIMGVLETRNLDFRHLIMLSVNEGQLPKSGGDSSFIPYNLRKAFGMTTIEHKIAVYAYYFYRLLQRAEKVTLLYNTSSDGLNRGEWSRFMLQFLIEWPHPIIRQYLETGQSPQSTFSITIPKTPEVMRKMQNVFDIRINKKAKFSPSALNYYLDCPLKFYYIYVAELSAPEQVSAEIDSATFGSIFHLAAENIYKDLTAHNNVIDKETLEVLLHNEVKLQDYVDVAFKELFFNVSQDEKPEYNGVQLINSAVISRYLKQLLENDLRYTPFTFVGSEQPVQEDIEIKTPKGIIKSRIGGIIDRLDSKDGTLRIVDYKTGGDADTPPNVESLFTPAKKRSNYVFQTFLYAAIMCRKQPLKVAPSLLYIHRAATETYSPVIQMGESRKPKEPVEDFSIYETEFRERLQVLLEDIFNPEIPFTQTEIVEKCTYCDFKTLCKR